MRRVRRRDTPGEVALRRELHARGLRYRVDASPLPGIRRKADVVFPRAHVAVFVDGCFWHGCAEHGTWPKANGEWWRNKIEANRRRDADTDARLREAGWTSIRVCEREPVVRAADAVESAVRSRA
jgi:DNA mismatch endonuclease, patch repair protein